MGVASVEALTPAPQSSDSQRGWWILATLAVFVVAVLLRLPAARESFWADELHSAWTVWDGIEQVRPRAAAGNQTSLYFWGLWFWKQVVGESELALRLSSILAVAAAAAVSVIAVRRRTGQLAAGVVAGGLLAVDTNAIFFGTELRPYAWVILCAAAATALFASIGTGDNARATMPVGWRWLGLIAVVCLAASLQPTSLLALLPLAGISSAMLFWRRADPGSRLSVLQLCLVLALLLGTAYALTRSAAADAWSARENWTVFASSHRWQQMWTVWPWLPMVVWPAVLAVGTTLLFMRSKKGTGVINAQHARGHDGNRPPSPFRGSSVWLWLLAIVIGVTVATWFASRDGWIPLWHRRYMIALLPMLAWIAGCLWGVVLDAAKQRLSPLAASGVSSALVAFAVLLLAWNQHTLQRLATGERMLVRRHEGWREAVAWLAARRQPEDPVWVAAELIESRELLPGSDEPTLPSSRRDYLNYVVGGPYAIDPSKPIGPLRASLASEWKHLTAGAEVDGRRSARSLWVLARYPAARLRPILKNISVDQKNLRRAVQEGKMAGFGGVTVLQFPLPPARLPAGKAAGETNR